MKINLINYFNHFCSTLKFIIMKHLTRSFIKHRKKSRRKESSPSSSKYFFSCCCMDIHILSRWWGRRRRSKKKTKNVWEFNFKLLIISAYFKEKNKINKKNIYSKSPSIQWLRLTLIWFIEMIPRVLCAHG